MRDKEFLFFEEVVAIARAPRGTVRHWIRTKKLPSVRPGRRRMIRRSDLEAFLKLGEVKGPKATHEGGGGR
jgi:excisionase family DNA binding protein